MHKIYLHITNIEKRCIDTCNMPSPTESEKISSNSVYKDSILEKLGVEYTELLLRVFPGQAIKI